MKFTEYFDSVDKKKRMSHVLNLIYLAMSDGVLDKRELELINVLSNEYGLSKDEYKRIIKRPESIKFHVPKSRDERLMQLCDMVKVMFVDGEIDESEIDFCKNIAKKLEFQAEIIDIIILKAIELLNRKIDSINALKILNEILENKNEQIEKKISENAIFNPNKILQNSIKNFQNKNNRLPTVAELEAEVINCACIYILKNYPSRVAQVSDVNLIYTVSEENFNKFQTIASDFTNAAILLFPNHYNEDLANIGNISIIKNISWSGMLDFLRVYYNDVHGVTIDNQSVNSETFISSKHDRLENRVKVSDALVRREIIMNFTNNKNKMLIEISPTMSPKNTYLINESDFTKKYKGDDPDFEFTLFYNNSGKVNKLVFERLDMNTIWIYT